jgi:cytochrome c553
MKLIALVLMLVSTVAIAAPVDPARCAGCHGYDLGASALGISRPINTLSGDKIYDALIKYKYGKFMFWDSAMIMKSRVDIHTDEELREFADILGRMNEAGEKFNLKLNGGK